MTEPLDRALTIPAVAAILGVDRGGVYDLINADKLAAFRPLGRTLRIMESEVRRYIQQEIEAERQWRHESTLPFDHRKRKHA